MTRARQRAWARHLQREAGRHRARRRLAAAAAGVFVLGVCLGLLGGFYLAGDGPAPDSSARAGKTAMPGESQVASRRSPGSEGEETQGAAPAPETEAAAAPLDSGHPDAGTAERQRGATAPPAPASEPRAGSPHPPLRHLKAPPPKLAGTGTAPRHSAKPDDTTSPPDALPAWRRHAVRTQGAGDKPRLAIVIDDLGLDRSNARAAIDLPAPLTLAFMTYAPKVAPLAAAARRAGHELLVHVPMQPLDPETDPGPRVLRADLSRAELLARLRWGLSRFAGYVGINNHMGSAFTARREGMRMVMAELDRRGLLFLDSVTASKSVGNRIASEMGIPSAARDIFLDNQREPAAIRRQLLKAEAMARRRGQAIAIAHPYDETLAILRDWLPRARARGLRLVPVSAVADPGRERADLARLTR